MPANIIWQSCVMNKFITNKLRTTVNRKQLHVSAIVYILLKGPSIYSIPVTAKVIGHDLHPEDMHGVCVCVCVSFWFCKTD
jgi:hypothetical protein